MKMFFGKRKREREEKLKRTLDFIGGAVEGLTKRCNELEEDRGELLKCLSDLKKTVEELQMKVDDARSCNEDVMTTQKFLTELLEGPENER